MDNVSNTKLYDILCAPKNQFNSLSILTFLRL